MDTIMLVGRLGRDPEMRQVGDTQVTNFSIAVDRSYTKADGMKVKETIWYRIATWRRLAETCAQYLSKGRQVLVVGQLSGEKVEGASGTTIVPRVYEANDGSHKAQFEVTAQRVEFLGGRGDAPSVEPDEIEEDEIVPF